MEMDYIEQYYTWVYRGGDGRTDEDKLMYMLYTM